MYTLWNMECLNKTVFMKRFWLFSIQTHNKWNCKRLFDSIEWKTRNIANWLNEWVNKNLVHFTQIHFLFRRKMVEVVCSELQASLTLSKNNNSKVNSIFVSFIYFFFHSITWYDPQYISKKNSMNYLFQKLYFVQNCQ